MSKRKRDPFGSFTIEDGFQRGIVHCEFITGYRFENLGLLMEAISMSSKRLTFRDYSVHVNKNDRLAIYGKSVAEAHLCHMWMDRSLKKGQWDNIRQDILGNKNLARVGFEADLDVYVGLPNSIQSLSPKSMATIVEAILGAVHLDGGDAALRTAMRKLGLMDHVHLDSFITIPSQPPPCRYDILPIESELDSVLSTLSTSSTAQPATDL